MSKTIADIKLGISGIEQSVQMSLDDMKDLEASTPIIVDPTIAKVIPRPPTFMDHCVEKISRVDPPATVGDFRDMLIKVEKWMGDIRDVLARMDPDKVLPEVRGGSENE
jgi:hypothetical protein